MKKRLFAIMLALALVLAAVPALAEEGAVEQDNTAGKKICTTEGCSNKVTNEGDLCADCAAKKAGEEAARKAAEEEAAKKAKEEAAKRVAEEAAKKAAEEEAAKKAAEEEAARKAAEEQKITEEETAKKSPRLFGEVNPVGAKTDNKCYHNHTAAWASTHPEVQGTMEEHPAVAATCTSEGTIKYYTCNNCGRYFVENGNTIDKIDPKEVTAAEVKTQKTNHNLAKNEKKAATCTEDGNIEYYECSVCKGKFADSTGMHPVDNIVIPALGHSVPADGEYTVKPTCTTAGKATYKCSKCNTTLENVEIPALGHSYGSPSWSWCGFTSAKATFTCTRNCGHSETETASIVRNSINSCGYYTYTATVQFNGKTYTDTRTDYSCRPDWYYDDCYYRNTCGHWGCGDVCTRYSNCVPCRNYRTTFRVGGYNCLATPKTGDVSVIGMALISLAGAGAAIMGKKRK